MPHHQVEVFACAHRDRLRKGVQHLEPPAIGAFIRVIGKCDAVRKIDVHPLDDADRDPVVEHRNRQLANFGGMFPGRQINPEKIDVP
ncbi:hypothetical protein GALL_522580 [mine drainage metagenome]|uniref:Uncharacterized protein n=1 Tax=mine drainage metagenome TaxID=410659 RepID=A0A1J5P617_9ZZZZ